MFSRKFEEMQQKNVISWKHMICLENCCISTARSGSLEVRQTCQIRMLLKEMQENEDVAKAHDISEENYCISRPKIGTLGL